MPVTACYKEPREVCAPAGCGIKEVGKQTRGVTKYTPVTALSKEPREVCAPAGCGIKEVGKQTEGSQSTSL
jgi:hypothetical protein